MTDKKYRLWRRKEGGDIYVIGLSSPVLERYFEPIELSQIVPHAEPAAERQEPAKVRMRAEIAKLKERLEIERIDNRAFEDREEKMQAEIERLRKDTANEKRYRVYYQDIVYAVCNLLDRLAYLKFCWEDGQQSPRWIVCGTADEPSTEVQQVLEEFMNHRKQQAAELERLRKGEVNYEKESAAVDKVRNEIVKQQAERILALEKQLEESHAKD